MDATHLRSAFWSGRRLAQLAVANAKNQGLLANAKVFACTDCGCAATEYDHRDYGRPLDVVPVCRRCNALRGKAIPRQWTDAELLAYARKVLTNNFAWKNHATYFSIFDYRQPSSDWHVRNWKGLRDNAKVITESAGNRFTVLDLAPELFHAVGEKAA